jgi:hypothetical protein
LKPSCAAKPRACRKKIFLQLILSYWSKTKGIAPWSLSRGIEAEEAKPDLEGDRNEQEIAADNK